VEKSLAMNKAFRFDRGRAACLLLHGFASTPSEVRWLGEQLYRRGYTVRGVLLAGHGTAPEDLAQTRWPDWYRSAEKAFLELKENHQVVFVAGVSMGGLLALMLAARYPGSVAAVVTAGTPGGRRFFRDWRIHLVPVLKYFLRFQRRNVPEDIKRLHEKMGRVYYAKRPLAAVHSLLKLVSRVEKLLPGVRCPVLIMHSRTDDVIRWQSAVSIQRHLPGTGRVSYVEQSTHIITMDKERDVVLERIDEFFRQIMGKEGVQF